MWLELLLGLEPAVMGLGPIFATRKALEAEKLSEVNDIGLVELNEAFASQSFECIRQLRVRSEKGQCKWRSYRVWTSTWCKWSPYFDDASI